MSTELFRFESFTAFSPYSSVGPYRAADYWRLPEGEPAELIRGRLIMSPSPSPLHQIVLGQLCRILQRAEDTANGLLLVSPMDVVLSDNTILQPDLLYLKKANRSILRERVEGPPDLVIEIISPGTDRRDRTEKLDLYIKYEVPEYWIVDPNSQVIEFFVLQEGRYVVNQPHEDCYQSSNTPEIEIELKRFWEVVDRKVSGN